MYWVWNHSRSKGTGRHVMLAVANWITGPDCTVRVSTPDLVRFSNAARSSVISAVDALLETGELVLLEEGRGTRSALYKIPGAVDYVRPEGGSRGPKTGPLADSKRSGNETTNSGQGSENRTSEEAPRGPKTGPQGSENRTSRGPKTGPHYQEPTTDVDEEPHRPARPAGESSSDARSLAQPLIDEMTRRGMRVSWQMQAREWIDLGALVASHGVHVLVDHAERIWKTSKTEPYSARYFLPGWRGLPETPAGAAPPPRAAGAAPTAPNDLSHLTDEEIHRALQF